MNRSWQRFLALCLTTFFALVNFQPAMAGLFGLPIQPPSIPGLNLQGQVEKKLYKELGKVMGEQAPLYLNQKAAFPEVKVEGFSPTVLHLRTVKDLVQGLKAGDYSIADIITFCSQNSIHRSGGGLGYKLAPMQGKQADEIATLLFRGMVTKIPPATIQAMSWRIQGGLPLRQWSAEERKLIHGIMPEFEGNLQGDLLEKYKAVYENFAGKIPGRTLPAFDQILDKLGLVGKTIKVMQKQHKILADQAIEDDKLPDLLYEAGNDPSPRVAPAQVGENSQWNEIRKGVYARLVITGGNLEANRLDLRILPEALHSQIPSQGIRVASAGKITFLPLAIPVIEAIGLIADLGAVTTATATEEEIIAALLQKQIRGLISYSLKEAAQALAPVLPVLMKNESDKSSSGKKNNHDYSPPQKGGPKNTGADKVRPKTQRARWQTKDRIYEWDYQHGEWEVYDKRGNHLGTLDISGKFDPSKKVPGRTTNP